MRYLMPLTVSFQTIALEPEGDLRVTGWPVLWRWASTRPAIIHSPRRLPIEVCCRPVFVASSKSVMGAKASQRIADRRLGVAWKVASRAAA